MKVNKKSRRRKLAAVLAVLLLLAGGTSAGTVIAMRSIFSRGDYTDPALSAYYRYDPDWKDKHPREEVSFTSGENELKGFIYGMENSSPRGLIVFAHGIGTGHESYIDQLMWFVEQGWRVFTYDATGSGYSEGSGTVGLVQSALDLDKALDYAEGDERLKGLDVYLLGHSWGGYAVSAVQNFDHDIKASAEISGYAYPVEMLDVGAEQTMHTKAAVVMHPFIWLYNKFIYGEYADLNAVEGINSSGLPNLLIHGENDDFVVYDRVSIVSKKAEITNPKAEFFTLTGEYADHNSFFNSDRCNEYKKPYNSRKEEIKKKYKGAEQTQKLKELISEMDRETVNDINIGLLEMIEDFYERA
ncbi:alpha/beta fold hydrolase [Ruminococcus sp.]|uniref:alpha/beta hydrolase n=1 Tax=Ruminococcus sp. TaxID=41978 RepID=UPI0025DA31D3|nr:alpha/beta fold hydrolase [Ruminococcus sp.]MBQ8966156.1 alpha/beta hydrolase [Ruminococcus sp.]